LPRYHMVQPQPQPQHERDQVSYSIYSHAGSLVVRDDLTEGVLGKVASDITISASIDSCDVVNAVSHLLPCKVATVDHDRDVIVVTCENDHAADDA
jgi:hypothetical protein